MKLTFPGGKRCAFSVFDDTDVATLDSIRPLYDYLNELGIRTTKSAWGITYSGHSNYEGSDTLENAAYAAYLRQLQNAGFEIGFHGASMESATRPEIERSLANFQSAFGRIPRINAAHGRNRDNLYWGANRFAFALSRRLYARFRSDDAAHFQGHLPDSPYFWGDLAQRHFDYVRSFTFTGVDLLSLNLPVVYRNRHTPHVKSWFLTNDAENVEEFNNLLSSRNQDILERAGGLCIISTHFGKGFVAGDQVHPVTRRLLEELSRRDCWFAPVSELLDFYVSRCGCPELAGRRLFRLEMRWLLDSMKRRRERRGYHPTELEYLKTKPR